MGKWNYRRRWAAKRYYRDQRLPSPPTYYETEFKLRGAWKNIELPWEERYCISVGIPWEKVLIAKKYMYCHDNVVKWNDSAGEDTFCDAKKRFWDKINGIASDDPQPDPDVYIDEIDWNPNIDPELVKELDQAYFNPDEAEKVEKSDVTTKTGDSRVLYDHNPTNSDNPWERNKDANLDNAADCSANRNISNPWERGTTEDNREIKDTTWGSCANKSWNKDITWGIGGGGESSSWHHNQYRTQRVDNNTWTSRGGYVKETGWKSNRDSYGRNSFSGAPKNSQRGEFRGRERWVNDGGDWDSNVSGQKRESCQQYTSSYKSARVQSDGNQWRRQRGQNKVSFAFQ